MAKKNDKPTPTRDLVFWFGLRAAAAKVCDRLTRAGERAGLVVGQKYPVCLEITGTANGRRIDQVIDGRLHRDADQSTEQSPAARDLLAAAIAERHKPERAAYARRIAKRDLADLPPECLELADTVIAHLRKPTTRSGQLHFTPTQS